MIKYRKLMERKTVYSKRKISVMNFAVRDNATYTSGIVMNLRFTDRSWGLCLLIEWFTRAAKAYS